MPASPSHPSSPAPPAPATPSSAVATPRRRRRLLQSNKSNTNSPSFAPASPFSFFPPTSPSPFHRFLPSPLRASSVPFSWEHRPGIPKTPARAHRSSSKSTNKALPLPPSLLSRPCAGGDPYVVPAEYAAAAMHPPPPGGRLGKVRRSGRRPRLGDALAEWLSLLSLYRSCKRAAACFASKKAKTSSDPWFER